MKILGWALALAGLFCLWFGFFGIGSLQGEWVVAGIVVTGGGIALIAHKPKLSSSTAQNARQDTGGN